MVAKVVKLSKESHGNSMYHFAAESVRILWKRRSLTVSSFKEFDENHKWKFMTWFDVSSLGFPLNFKMSEGNLCIIIGHQGAYKIGSLVCQFKFGNSRVATNGNCQFKLGWAYPGYDGISWEIGLFIPT